ncbi:hypothetical protein GCM10028832_25980 [Streptomyces sparsus]
MSLAVMHALGEPDAQGGGPRSPGYVERVRVKVEFTTEPFDLDEAPQHAVVAREVVQAADLDAVDVGPFGNTAEGSAEHVIAAVSDLLRETLRAGATRVSLQLNVVPSGPEAGETGPGGAADGTGAGEPGVSA